METLSLVFSVDVSCTAPTEAVYVVGSTSTLGKWAPQKGLACKTTKEAFPIWTSTAVSVPAGGTLEFKLLKMRTRDSVADLSSTVWEPIGGNRTVLLPSSIGKTTVNTISCKWGEARSESLKCGDGIKPSLFSPPSSQMPERQTSTGSASGGIRRMWSRHIVRDLNGTVNTRISKVPSMCCYSSSALIEAAQEEERNYTLSAENEQRKLDDIELDWKLLLIDPPPDLRKWLINSRDEQHKRLLELITLMKYNDCDTALISQMRTYVCSKNPKELRFSEDGKAHAREEFIKLFGVQAWESARRKEVDDRGFLDVMQRRMQSCSLLEDMAKLTEKADVSDIVLLQGFNWESWRAGGGDWYGLVSRRVNTFKQLGVTDVWLPPPSQSVAEQGYLPSQLFNLDDSKYGTKASLISLLDRMREVGIRGVCDIVINHRCGDVQDSEGRWNVFTPGKFERQESFDGVMDWRGWAITLGDKFSDGTGLHAPSSFDGKFDAAPDIDHANEQVQNSISIWLRWLRLTVGFDAWRFDFVKGYRAQYVGKYCKKSSPAWAVGELWCDMEYDDNGLKHPQDNHRRDIINWINGTDKESTAFDFTTKGVLQEACGKGQYWRLKDKDGKPPGVIGWMPTHAVTFIDNHDTGSTQRHWPFPDDKVMVGYAYTLTHPGIPSLFWDHIMDWGDDFRKRIGDLIKARRTAAIKVDSPVNIKCAEQDLYIAEVGTASSGLLRIALGSRASGDPDRSFWSAGLYEGKDYRVWVHAAPTPKAEPVKAPLVQATAPKVQKPTQVEKVEFRENTRVRLHGLTKANKYNGKTGVLQNFIAKEKRWSVRLDSGGDPIQVKEANMVAQEMRFSFEPITVDGQEITPQLLESDIFDKELGRRLLSRLDEVRDCLAEATHAEATQ